MKDIIFNRVVKQGTIGIPNDLIWSYKKIGLTEEELVVLLLLFAFGQKKNNFYPDLGEVADLMEKDMQEVQSLIASLMEKECLSIEREYSLEEQAFFPVFSCDPLFKKLGKHVSAVNEKKREIYQDRLIKELAEKEIGRERPKNEPKDKDIFTVFEEEFGRLLTNTERAYVVEWIKGDSYTENLVLEALRSSVSRDKLNFKYIDTILRDWERKGIRTAKQARMEDQKTRVNRKTKSNRASKNFTEEKAKSKYDHLVVNMME